YALTHDLIIYDSLVKQFWSTASLRASKEGPPAILATIDKTSYTITESLVRSQLQLDDEGSIEDLPIAKIYLGMDNLGYPSEGKLTFFKNKFSPQWRFLVHTIMHCLSTKTGSWDQFGSQLAIAIICLTEGRRYNWSSYIFKGMVNNINNPKKFLMFPRFLQMILEPKHTKQYHAFKLTTKMFANMRLNFHRDHMPLIGTMLPPPQAAIAGESSGEDAPSNPQTVPATITEPDHSHDHASTPPRPTTTTSGALVTKQGPFSDPNIASSTRPHESSPDLFTSTNVEYDTMGGSFHSSPPRSTQAPPEGTTSGGAEDLDKLTALSSLVSTLVQKVNSQESDLQAHKLLFKEVVGKLVKRVKLLEVQLKGRKRKVVLTDSDKEEDAELNVDPLIKLAQAAATAAAASVAPTDGFHEAKIPPSSSVPTDDSGGGSEVPAGDTTGPSTIYPSSIIVPTTSSVPVAAPIPAGSGTTPESPSSPERDARKGKGIAVDTPSPTQHKTFKQLEEERLGWEAAERLQAQELADFEKQRAASLMKDANLARQMMVELVNTRRKELAEQRAQERRDRPMTPSQLRQYMRTYVKNQGPAVYSTGWTMAQVRKLTPEQLQEEFDKIQRAVAFTRGFKRDGSPKTRASSKKLKTGGDDVNLAATSHGVPQEEAGATPSPNVSQEEVAAPSHSQDIPDAPVKAPSTTASTAQHTGSSPKKVGTRKKRLGRKGVHPSHSTIPIEDGDPEAEHKMCIKYASDADSASDDDTPVNLFAVVDWELLPTGLGWINVIYRKDNSRKISQAEVVSPCSLWGDLKVLIDSPEVNDGSEVWKNQNTWNIQSWKLYSYSGVHVLEIVGGLVIHMFVDKKYPLSVNLIERMLDHQLEICQDTVGNELTTAVQLIAFLKNQIADSRHPKVHDCPEQTATGKDTSNPFMAVMTCQKSYSSSTYYDSCSESGKWFQSSMDLTLSGPCLDADFLVADSKFMKVAFGDGFKMLLFNPLVCSTKDLSRNLKLTMSNSSLGEDFPTGKDNSIVSTGSTKVIPAGVKIYLGLDLQALFLGEIFMNVSTSVRSRTSGDSSVAVYLLYGSAGVRVITPAAGGHSYKENSRKVATVPAGRLCGSYWSAYGFFCLPCPILFVIAASIIGPQTPLDFGRCDGYGLDEAQTQVELKDKQLSMEDAVNATKMTTTVVNNSLFRMFFEKQKLTGINFMEWYRNLRIVLSVEDKLPFLEQLIPAMPVLPARQVLPSDVLNTHTA
ncbi:hypothetical protein Tco_0806999, partial [Tanacetum coccineum]